MNSVEEVRQRLLVREIFTGDALDRLISEWRTATGGDDSQSEDLIDWLIQKREITEFQGDSALAINADPVLLGGYRVYEQIAPSQLGGLYRAVHDEFDQPVTLKICSASLSDGRDMSTSAGREARIIATSDHPNIVQSFQVGRAGEVYYLAIEELKGETLADRLQRENRLPYVEACRIGRDVARGLAYLHENEVIHRDLRPETIWVSETGATKLFDFAGATDAFAQFDVDDDESEPTESDLVVGRYEYMAWEQALDPTEADARSDIYALGCLMYHCLAGRPPFTDDNSVKLALKHATVEPKRISDEFEEVPSQIDDTLAGMLAKDPDDRFQKTDDVAFALSQYAPDDRQKANVAVVALSDEYLKWAQAQRAPEPHGIAEDATGVTPELTEFLGRMSRRRTRRNRRSL